MATTQLSKKREFLGLVDNLEDFAVAFLDVLPQKRNEMTETSEITSLFVDNAVKADRKKASS